MNILIIEGSRHNIELYKQMFMPKFTVQSTSTGNHGKEMAMSLNYDLILIGAYIPDVDYVSLTQTLRNVGVQAPILITASKGTKAKALAALNIGADDYILKPVEPAELLAKVRALLRRSGMKKMKEVYRVGELELDSNSFRVTQQGQSIYLRRREFQLLEYLMMRAGEVVCRDEVFEKIWSRVALLDKTIDVHIKYLRDKIDRPFNCNLIKTVYGYGYMISDP